MLLCRLPWLSGRTSIRSRASSLTPSFRHLSTNEPPPSTFRSSQFVPKDDEPLRRVTHAFLLQNANGEVQTENDQRVKVAGLVRSIRKQKRVAFAHIQDGSTYEPIQAIMSPEIAAKVTNGAYVQLIGTWQKSPGTGQSHELQVSNVANVGESNADENPIQKQSMPPEYLRGIPHMRIRTPFQSLLARTRSHLIRSVGDFFENGLPHPAIQVHPPLITSSDCEGAGEVFTLSPQSYKTPPESDMPSGSPDKPKLFFRDQKYLTVSSQLHLEAWSAELGDVWTLSPTFRAEESDTTRHLAEFYMLEAEFRGVGSLPALASTAERLIRHLTASLSSHGTGKELLALYTDRKHRPSDTDTPDLGERWSKLLPSHPYPSITYGDAMQALEANHEVRDKFQQAPSPEKGLTLEHERWIVQNIGNGLPTIVTGYPRSQKPFYMLPGEPEKGQRQQVQSGTAADTVACFDILLPHGYAEVCGGSLREHRLPNLINAMRDKKLLKTAGKDEVSDYPHLQPGESLGNLQWYTDLRRFGSSHHGGFGLGFDRLLAYLTGASNVKDVVGFPRYWGRAEC